jgi:hypothetical protein
MKPSAAWLSLLLPALAQAAPLSEDAAGKLAALGLVVIDESLRQGFSAYIGPEHPVFVTSDSLLMAYHRLFEEDVAQGELLDLANQREFWPSLWKKLPAKPLSDAAGDLEGHRRCRLVVATALRLLAGTVPEGLGAEEKVAVEAEAARVEKGEGSAAPEWLQSAKAHSPYISYQAFRPGSFHEGVAVLERYYRFRKWLQEMPLDLGDEATRSMAEHLGFSLTGTDVDHLSFVLQPMFRGETGLFTALLRDAWQTVEPDGHEAWRKALHEIFKERQDWRFLHAMTPAGSEIARELLPTRQVTRTPEVLAAALGSPVAAALLGPEHQTALAAEKQRQAKTWGYFQALQALHAAPDPRAPDLLRSEAWQRKQLNATLGSWAEYRYALQLSSREDQIYRSGSPDQPGFVEPLPDFFHCLGEATSYDSLAAKSFRKIADLRLAMKLEKLIVHLQLAEAERSDDSVSGNYHYFKVGQSEEILNCLFPPPPPGGEWDWLEEKDRRTVEGLLKDFMKTYWQGKPETMEKVRKESADLENDLSPRWAALATTCFRLESMAERQLSGKPWRESDIRFLKGYGAHLGWLMFYEGNSYTSPDDDAPRIARYATDASPQGTRVHHAAVARPRRLLLHYPDQAGKPVLCQGAVYAFRHVERDRTPTRAEWNSESEKVPRPAWMDPITGAPAPTKGR